MKLDELDYYTKRLESIKEVIECADNFKDVITHTSYANKTLLDYKGHRKLGEYFERACILENEFMDAFVNALKIKANKDLNDLENELKKI